MELQTIAVMGKFLVNSIFPFFKESKALGLIKNDTLEISDDLFAKLYDSVKKVFIKDERRSIVAQLEELNKNPNDNVLQATPKIAIAQKLQEKGEFYNEIQSVVAEIENKYQEKSVCQFSEKCSSKAYGNGNSHAGGA